MTVSGQTPVRLDRRASTGCRRRSPVACSRCRGARAVRPWSRPSVVWRAVVSESLPQCGRRRRRSGQAIGSGEPAAVAGVGSFMCLLVGVHAVGLDGLGGSIGGGSPLRVVSCQRPTTSLPSQPKSMKTAMPSSGREDQRRRTSAGRCCASGTAPSGCRCPCSPCTEEQLADDGADHRQAGGDAEAGEDRRHRGGELQLGEPRPARRAAEGEQVVLAASTDCRPNSVFDTIGKIEMITQTRIRVSCLVAEDRCR